MSVRPVITRELRAQARQSFTYWLRGLGVLTLLVGGVWFMDESAFEPNVGGFLYGRLHLMTYFALWLLVPLGAADCISRERREGTLGLLFLTPLRPPHIVIAKGFVHGLRATTFVVAIVPVLMIPFLLGGVVWQQAALSVVIFADAICWCLAAALVASSLARNNNRAMAFTMLFACFGFIGFPWLVGVGLGINSPTTWNTGYRQSTYDFFAGFWVVAMPVGDFSHVLRMFKLPQIVAAVGFASAVSVAVLVFAVVFAANCLRRLWRDQPASARVEKMERVFFRPVVGKKFLQRWMQRKLEHNPIGWLEQRQWSGRLVTWSWFAIIISIYSLALTDNNFFRNSEAIQNVLGWLLAMSMAVTAAGSFRRERETGVLELLLVSPLSARQIINGRLRGLWGQFLPSILTLLSIWLYFMTLLRGAYFSGGDWGYGDIWSFAVMFGVTPVIGLYFSVRCRYYLVALVLTIGFAMVLPILLSSLGQAMSSRAGFDWGHGPQAAWFFQIIIAAYLHTALHRKLERRQFPLERALG
jgi:ABC-type transport system involved in multi-copper enzyme maturation permease subunit